MRKVECSVSKGTSLQFYVLICKNATYPVLKGIALFLLSFHSTFFVNLIEEVIVCTKLNPMLLYIFIRYLIILRTEDGYRNLSAVEGQSVTSKSSNLIIGKMFSADTVSLCLHDYKSIHSTIRLVAIFRLKEVDSQCYISYKTFLSYHCRNDSKNLFLLRAS